MLRPDTATRLVDALAVLLVRLHVIGFFWGDVSLSNTLFRRDAGSFAAYLVDAETGELHDKLTDGQREHDLQIARTNLFGEFELDPLTLAVGALAIVLLILQQVRTRRGRQKYGQEVEPAVWFVVKLALVSAAIGFFAYALASYKGIPVTLIVLAVLILIYGIIMNRSVFGRHIYAIGGNEQSARLMGLSVVRTKLLAYVISGVCAGLAGVVFTAYTGASYPLNGIGTELDTIAAVVIGGTLLTGGSGFVLGSMIGVFGYGTIKTAISFLGVDQSWTRITIGALLLVFVVVQRLLVARTARTSR
jgi:ABC-type xylose transport system permease subunit